MNAFGIQPADDLETAMRKAIAFLGEPKDAEYEDFSGYDQDRREASDRLISGN